MKLHHCRFVELSSNFVACCWPGVAVPYFILLAVVDIYNVWENFLMMDLFFLLGFLKTLFVCCFPQEFCSVCVCVFPPNILSKWIINSKGVKVSITVEPGSLAARILFIQYFVEKRNKQKYGILFLFLSELLVPKEIKW